MVLRPILRTIQRKILRPIFAAAQRIFITVNGVDEYFTFQNTKTFPDDFDLSIDAVLPTTATTVTLFGQTASADHYIKVLSTGFASINIDTSIVTSTVLATKDNKQRVYGVKLIGNDFIFTEDGATIDTVTDAVAAAKTLIINVIAQSNGTDFFNKTLSDPILTDLTTASNSVSWQLNRASPATTEQSTDGTNRLTYVGAPKTELFTFNQSAGRWKGSNERVVNGIFDTGTTGWTPLDSAILSVVSMAMRITNVGANFGKASQTIPTTSEETYELIFDGLGGTSTARNVRVGTILAGTDLLPNTAFIIGSNTFTFTATTSNSFLSFVNNPIDANFNDVDNVSIKRFIQIA